MLSQGHFELSTISNGSILMVYRSQDAGGSEQADKLDAACRPEALLRADDRCVLICSHWRLIATAARMLGRFRHLEAPEEQPEGEKDDLEHGDGKGKDAAPP
jgi:hypothetical protein